MKEMINQVFNEDCLETMKRMANKSIDVIVTDPPFNVGYKYSTYKDKMEDDKYYELLNKIIGEKPCVIIHYGEQLHKLSIKLGKAPEKIVSWVYNSNTGKQHRQIAFYGFKPNFKKVGQPYKNPTDKRIAKRILEGKQAKLYDWWNINQVKNVSKEKTEHPCQMPLEVMEKIIGILPDNFKTIYDPFPGSGTTLVACKSLGLNYIGSELDEDYYKIIQKRLSAVQGSLL